MIDCETLSTSTNATILSIGAVKFDLYGDEINNPQCDKFYCKINIESCNDLNLDIDDSTIEWWAKQSKEAQEEAFNSEGRIDVQDAFNQLYHFCWGCNSVWSNGSGFDLKICENIFRKIGRATPWQYWQERDCRTIYDLGIDPNFPPILKHHALEDAYRQAVGVQNVVRKLKEFGLNPFTKR